MNSQQKPRKFRWQTGLSTILLLVGAFAVWLSVNDQYKKNDRIKQELPILRQVELDARDVICLLYTSDAADE